VTRPAAGRPRSARGRRPAPGSDSRPTGERGGPERLIGVHPVEEALRARRRRLHRLLLRRGGGPLREALLALGPLAQQAGVPVQELAAADFDRLAPPGLPHQGVLLEAGPVPELTLEDLLPGPDEGGWLVALDGVEDPQNLGAILRVADAAGARGALLPERRAAPLSPAVARASAGALEHLPVARVGNLARALHLLKDRGFWVHGAAPEASLDLYEAPDRLFDRRLVLVVGAEGRGLRPGVRAAVDTLYRIPMQGRVASLNVATAAAVVLFEWARRARRDPLGSGEQG
jgi:23S rRNA (guanosine2251-2'-O)-methyltransferase